MISDENGANEFDLGPLVISKTVGPILETVEKDDKTPFINLLKTEGSYKLSIDNKSAEPGNHKINL